MKTILMSFISLSFTAIFLTSNGQSPAIHYNGKIIDLHVHIGLDEQETKSMSTTQANSLRDILSFMKSIPIDKIGIITMAHKGDMADTRRRNDSIIALSKQYPSLIPICSVHPMDGEEAFVEMARIQKKGVQIIKLHPNTQHFDVSAPEVAAVARKAGELHMILLFDSYSLEDPGEIGKLVLLAATHPDARFIFAHMGLMNFSQLLVIDGLKKYPWFKSNIWMDLSAIAPVLGDSPFREQLVWTIRKIGITQFLFGSDFPIFSPGEAIKGLHAMGLTAAEEKQVCYTNACTLLQIQP